MNLEILLKLMILKTQKSHKTQKCLRMDAKMMNYILTIMETTVSGMLRTLIRADNTMPRA
jgi:hypothetical protein